MAISSLSVLLLAWLLLFALARELAARNKIDKQWSLSWALASVGWGAILTVLVEVSSRFECLDYPTLLSGWIFVDLVLAATLFRLRRTRLSLPHDASRLLFWELIDQPWTPGAACWLAVAAFFAAVLFVVALATATTNWDSLTYHLPRFLHWLQQSSVEHFPTNNSRQVEFGPWSSFALMHLFVFWGNDRLLNLLQWFSLLSILIVAGGIVTRLSVSMGGCFAGKEGRQLLFQARLFTCLVVITLPIALVQSITTQNDLITTFWLCCFVLFGLALLREPENGFYALGVGLALGLGTLTKATTYVYAAPFVAAFAIAYVFASRSSGNRPVLWRPLAALGFRNALIAGLPFLLLNAGHMLRNDDVYGSPLASRYMMSIERNQRLTFSTACSGVIRNVSLHTNTGIPPVTRALNLLLAKVHRFTGEGLNDPATTYHHGRFDFWNRFRVQDSYASNPWHLALIAVLLGALVWRPLQNKGLLAYAALILASFVIFCACLKWQYWHTRLHMAYFILFAPLIGLKLVQWQRRWLLHSSAVLLTVFAACSLWHNESRPLSREFLCLPREKQYMAVHAPHLNEPMLKIAQSISACGSPRVGLKLSFDDPEYPLWMMLRNRGFDGQIEHVYVHDNSFRLAKERRLPSVLLASMGKPPQEVLRNYPCIQTFGEFTLLWNKDLPPASLVAEGE